MVRVTHHELVFSLVFIIGFLAIPLSADDLNLTALLVGFFSPWLLSFQIECPLLCPDLKSLLRADKVYIVLAVLHISAFHFAQDPLSALIVVSLLRCQRLH